MIRVLITNAYSARNRGDGAIVLGMLESLDRAFGNEELELVISSADHPADQERYPVPVVPSFHSLMGRISRNGTLQGLLFLAVLMPLSIVGALVKRFLHVSVPLPAGLTPLLDAYARADLVVAAGGGYLYTTSRRRGAVMLLVHLHSFMLGRVLDKPVYLYAQSIGPFASSVQARLVRAALRRVQLVELRESWSVRLVASWGLPIPVHAAADAAFLLRPVKPKSSPLGARRKSLRLGLTVRRWHRQAERQEAYEETMARFLRMLVERHDPEIIFLPQVTVERREDDDRETARRILDRLGPPVDARLLDHDYSPREMQWLCGQMDCLVGTRMHSNIFALTMGVPVVAVAYQPKTLGIMEQLGLEEFVLSIDNLAAEALLELVERLLAGREAISASLARALPEIQSNAWEAARLIAEDFSERRHRRSAEGAR